MKTTGKTYSVIIALLFAGWIAFPFFHDILFSSSGSSVSQAENRNLAEKPHFGLHGMKLYPAAYEAFFRDHFVFRPRIMREHAHFVYRYFRRSPVPEQADLGRDGWIYFSKKDRKIYEGRKTLTNDQVNLIVKELHSRAADYRARGIRFYLCFVPMTQEIYPEYLPDNYYRSKDGTQTDKVVAAIKQDPTLNYIDLKQILINEKKTARVYRKTDNHWNSLGSFYAYSAILERMKQDFPALKPLRKSDIRFKRVINHGEDLANLVGLSDVTEEDDVNAEIISPRAHAGRKAGYVPVDWFPYKDVYEDVSVVDDSTLPKLFVIRDSFFTLTIGYIRENFSKTVAIWDAWMYQPNYDLIEKEKPDIVLLMMVESNIGNILTGPVD